MVVAPPRPYPWRQRRVCPWRGRVGWHRRAGDDAGGPPPAASAAAATDSGE